MPLIGTETRSTVQLSQGNQGTLLKSLQRASGTASGLSKLKLKAFHQKFGIACLGVSVSLIDTSTFGANAIRRKH